LDQLEEWFERNSKPVRIQASTSCARTNLLTVLIVNPKTPPHTAKFLHVRDHASVLPAQPFSSNSLFTLKSSSTRVQDLTIIAAMASKFMVNPAFKARLLLRPSHQRTVLFRTVNKLECLIPGRSTLPLILSSRSYSHSTPTPPLPKSSESTKDSQSSGPEDKNWFHPKGWVKGGAAMVTVGLVRAGSCRFVYTSLKCLVLIFLDLLGGETVCFKWRICNL